MTKPLVILSLLLSLLLAASAAPAPGMAASRGKLYVIGLGPAGPQTATLQALETIQRMDAVICQARNLKPFARYIGQIPVWFDHVDGLWDLKGKFFTKLSPSDLKTFHQERARLTKQRMARIEGFLAQGKNVGMLEAGNPCVFSSSHWYTERMNPADVVYIAGMGSDAAAMAALKTSLIPAHKARFLLQSAPFVITDDNRDFSVLAKLAPLRPSMIFYMVLKKPGPFFSALQKAFGPDTPCAVVFWAGWPDRQKVLRSTLGAMPAKLAQEPERVMGLLLVGDFLRPKAYLSAEE